MPSSPVPRTRLPAVPFPLAVSPHSGYLSASAFFLSASRLHPLGFRFRFWLLGLELYPFRYLSVASFSVLSQRPWLDYHTFFHLSTTFLKIFIFFSNFYYKAILIFILLFRIFQFSFQKQTFCNHFLYFKLHFKPPKLIKLGYYTSVITELSRHLI